MRNVLLINGDLYKSESTSFLINAYAEGVISNQGIVDQIRIADLLFNFNQKMPSTFAQPLETDLKNALRQLHWARHIVLFCPVYREYIPSKIKGFFDRLFNANQKSFDVNKIENNFFGKSARIVSILDDELFKEYNLQKKADYLSIRKEIFERVHINPVRTSTMGSLHDLHNAYSVKWHDKLFKFGQQDV